MLVQCLRQCASTRLSLLWSTFPGSFVLPFSPLIPNLASLKLSHHFIIIIILDPNKSQRVAELRESFDQMVATPERYDAFLAACFKYSAFSGRPAASTRALVNLCCVPLGLYSDY